MGGVGGFIGVHVIEIPHNIVSSVCRGTIMKNACNNSIGMVCTIRTERSMHEGWYLHLHGYVNPGMKFDGGSCKSSFEAGKSKYQDSGEVSARLQIGISIVPVIAQSLQVSGPIRVREIKCNGSLGNVTSSRLRAILHTNSSGFPPALQNLWLADAKDVLQELPCIMLPVQLGPVS